MRKYVLAIALVCLVPFTAAAKAYPPEAQHHRQVPEWLEEALTKHESRLNPNALNINGVSYFPATRADALILLRGAVADNARSFDVGLWQVNNWWCGQFGIDPEDLLDPEYNELWGRWVLAEEISRHGLTWKAVGKYHSPDDEKGRAYAWRVFRAADKEKVKAWFEGQRNAKQKNARFNVPDGRGISGSKGERRQGGLIPIKIPTPDQHGPASKKP
ncbi:lytic transglycosylase domain-containing protein [Desulfovibrio sp. OttesenSCG-928-I05]|nr:lytic transglycosylase domain-containing protein [Desulfovibrio sp. OttesenSCG-928-O18]MDL2271428.1 lytic transglycosylase domain-containing protein [Desulfovibrio sp. OttesenSCG-928-I05]